MYTTRMPEGVTDARRVFVRGAFYSSRVPRGRSRLVSEGMDGSQATYCRDMMNRLLLTAPAEMLFVVPYLTRRLRVGERSISAGTSYHTARTNIQFDNNRAVYRTLRTSSVDNNSSGPRDQRLTNTYCCHVRSVRYYYHRRCCY